LFDGADIVSISTNEFVFVLLSKVNQGKLIRGRGVELDGEIERELTLLGSTAIEDKLQDEVADTIRFMKRPGIKVWVLTGDKVQTAIEIGVSAGLIDETM
jgi:magnesium-transporting ATPase (P-type)